MNEIKVLSPSFLRSLSGESPPGENSLPLRLGETLGGRVARQIDSRHAFLHLRGQNLLVESHVPLPPGVELQFRVEELDPRVILRLLPPESSEDRKIYSLLKRHLAGDIPLEILGEKMAGLGRGGFQGLPPAVRDSGNQFLALLRSFSSPSGLFPADPRALRELIDQSGLFWENKIKNWMEGGGKDPVSALIQGDLKGLGLKLLSQVKGFLESSRREAAGPMPTKESTQGLESFLRKVDLYQVLNLQPSDGPERYYLFLPFWLGSHLQWVELNLSFPRKEPAPEEREELSVLFLLNLPALGKVRIEVQVKERDLFCRFMVSDSGVSEFIRHALPGLGERLRRLGFHPYIKMSTEPEGKMKETLMSGLDRGPVALFNIII